MEMKKGGEKLSPPLSSGLRVLDQRRPKPAALRSPVEFPRILDLRLRQAARRTCRYRLTLEELPKRYTALNFLFPEERKPIFNNDREAVSRKAADQMAELFRSLIRRPGNAVPRTQAQRFVLQTVVSMVAEDIDLLPSGAIQVHWLLIASNASKALTISSAASFAK